MSSRICCQPTRTGTKRDYSNLLANKAPFSPSRTKLEVTSCNMFSLALTPVGNRLILTVSNHVLDKLDPHFPGSDSTNSPVRIRKRDKFRKFWCSCFSRSKSKEVESKASNRLLHTRPDSQLPTRPSSIVIQVDNVLPGDMLLSIVTQVNSEPSSHIESVPLSGIVQDEHTSQQWTQPMSIVSQVCSLPPGNIQSICTISNQSTSPIGDNQPAPPSTAQYKALLEPLDTSRNLEDIFDEDLPEPTIKTDLPEIQQRIEMTQQLEPALDRTELDWIEMTKKDPMEADRLRWLASQVVEQFIADTIKNSTKIVEIVALGPVLEKESYCKLLSTFIKKFDDARILDLDLLQGLVQLVQDASPDYLVSDDLVKILGTLKVRLEGTHQQSTVFPYHLTLAVSRVLDVMADHKLLGLDRAIEHEPLSNVLLGLQGSSDPYLLFQASYAFQALQYVPNDESALQTVWRHSTVVVQDLVKVTAIFKLDLASVFEVWETYKKHLLMGYWWLAAYAFAQAGQVTDLKKLIVEAPCRRDPLLQWGICQPLGEIAVDPAWAISARQQAITLLGHLCQHDQDWGQDESVKAWILTIITNLCASSDQTVNDTARSVLQELYVDQIALIKHTYPLRSRIPIPDTVFLEPVTNVAWNPVVPMEFVTGSEDGSVRVWRISRADSGDVLVHLHWGSHSGQLWATDLTFERAVGLSPISQRLLVQRGVVEEYLLSEDDESLSS
ncbi:MAG: hypothetical protein JOS17DRAFT_817286 [Linnemannia elongata]|nr:MAG: hypothetical protein JOS17DRAFT_817286 [Linnemannia elongata]